MTPGPPERPPGLPPVLPPAGASIDAAPGAVRTVAAEELGYELVGRCDVTFSPCGEDAPVTGRLAELVQPRTDDEPREPGLEERTTLFVIPDGADGPVSFPAPAVPYPVPRGTPVTVTVLPE